MSATIVKSILPIPAPSLDTAAPSKSCLYFGTGRLIPSVLGAARTPARYQTAVGASLGRIHSSLTTLVSTPRYRNQPSKISSDSTVEWSKLYLALLAAWPLATLSQARPLSWRQARRVRMGCRSTTTPMRNTPCRLMVDFAERRRCQLARRTIHHTRNERTVLKVNFERATLRGHTTTDTRSTLSKRTHISMSSSTRPHHSVSTLRLVVRRRTRTLPQATSSIRTHSRRDLLLFRVPMLRPLSNNTSNRRSIGRPTPPRRQ